MNQRIRYSKLTDGTFVSMKVLTAQDGKQYRAYMEPDLVTGWISDVTSPTDNVIGVASASPHKLKIKLKNALMSLGCVFEKETRGKNDLVE